MQARSTLSLYNNVVFPALSYRHVNSVGRHGIVEHASPNIRILISFFDHARAENNLENEMPILLPTD